jgi:rubrerythrin
MGYTDLWRCKRCGTMPEIVMLGKNFLVKCPTCNSEKVNVYADNIDEVVADWNHANNPHRRTLLDRVRHWFGRD